LSARGKDRQPLQFRYKARHRWQSLSMMLSPLLAAIQFRPWRSKSGKIHNIRKARSFRCIKVPTAGD
jgi:hypothetical protein